MSVRAKFDHYATEYDASRRQLIPCFDDFYGTVIDLLDRFAPAARSVLDIGAGTGLLSRMIAAHNDEVALHLVDMSPKMLEIAREHHIFRSRDVSVTVLDMEKIAGFSGTFDVIVSSLAIHHLPSSAKRKLFGDLAKLLNSGGLFVNADQALGATPETEAMYRMNWLDRVKAVGVSSEALKGALDRMKEDKMDTLQEQLQWLSDAQFTNVNCWFQDYSFCVYSGQKAG